MRGKAIFLPDRLDGVALNPHWSGEEDPGAGSWQTSALQDAPVAARS